jgi:tetratricopeptide (TPR) repeat protein/transcriptional regulator with XRE-family HTH domain
MTEGGGASFGTRLRASRVAAGISQAELAELSGVSIRAISDLERGRTRWPHRDSLRRLADALKLGEVAGAELIALADRRLTQAAVEVMAPSVSSGAADDGAGRVVPRQLPAAVPAFVGRRDQLAALTEVLAQPGGTAVISVIVGTAGVGKTALALQWAHQFAAEFPDGQLFVNLRGFDPSGTPVTPAAAVRMLLDALGVRADQLPQTVEAQLGLWRSLLAGKRMLVVLDNARDAAQVRPLLPGSPASSVIVTSLAAIEAAYPLVLDVLTGTEAGQLLQQRLGAARLAAEPGAAAQIIESCARLPLALSVIAARAAMRPGLPLTQVAADLGGQEDLEAFVGGGDPAADVRAVLSWSYRQLDSATARAFRLAGQHPGPEFDRYAVAALTGTTAGKSGHLLDVLAHACMVQPSGPDRYGMHDLLRGYARELAAGSGAGDERAALSRLFDYYLHTASTAVDTLLPAEQYRRPFIPPPDTPVPAITSEAAARAWLDAQRPSLAAATVQMADNGWPGHATRLSVILFRYLEIRAHHPDAITVYSSACRAARSIGDRAAEASALNYLSYVDFRLGRYQQAVSQLEQSLAAYQEAGDPAGHARTLSNLGFVEFHLGRCQQGVRHLEQALAMYREVDDPIGRGNVLVNLGFADLRQGRYRQAIAHLQQAQALYRRIGDMNGAAHALSNLGEAELRQGRHQQAASHLHEALALCRKVGERRNEADILALLGIADLSQGACQQATSHLNQALALSQQANDMSVQAAALNGLGEVLLATGSTADARSQYDAALDVAAQVGEKYEQARAHAGLARAYRATGDTGKSHYHGHQALTRYTELGAPEANQIGTQLTVGNTARSEFLPWVSSRYPVSSGRRRRRRCRWSRHPSPTRRRRWRWPPWRCPSG